MHLNGLAVWNGLDGPVKIRILFVGAASSKALANMQMEPGLSRSGG